MLSAGKLGRGQERYYLEKVAEGAEDYYSGEGEAPGQWLGDGAEDLGLSGQVEPDQLVAMLTGRHPAPGEPLGLRHVDGGAVPGFDLTFSAPKSVSLSWALGGPPVGAEVSEAHVEAVKAGLDYLQQTACLTRRGAGGREFVQGNGFLAAGYTHRSSRAGDPQLHTHVLVANATKGPDGRYTRLYHPGIYHQLKTAGYVYEAHLRSELTQRLGVQWGEVRNGIAEIEGFDPEHLKAFSTRRAEILEAAGGEGASARAMQVATLATREAKDSDLATESLRELWRNKAQETGLTREAIHSTFDPGRAAIPDSQVAIAEVEATLTAHASHFDRRDAIQAVAENLPNGAPGAEVVELADAYLSRPDVISIASTPKGERFTTRAIWELEQTALASAEAMAARTDRAVVDELIVNRVVARRPSMKTDQEAMVRRLLAGGEGLVVVVGEAGTGKTYATTAAAHGWAHARTELRVAAPTWRAANVLRSEGLNATSVARLLAELDRGTAAGQQALARGSVLLVDEAGMVDSRALARLVEHAQKAEAKLVLIGDPAQLGEIEAGGLFGAIVARSEPVVLDEVIRHRHELEREAAKMTREGRGAEALSVYQGAERVTVSDDPLARREAMVADWWEHFREGEDALMIAKTNREVAALNALAREEMRAAAKLGAEEIAVGEARFAAGDQVITRINDQATQIYNRERWHVAEVDAESGSLVLVGIDTRGRVCVDSDYLGRVRPGDGGPALEHGYAATTYQAQGATVDSAFVMADPSMDRQEFYVATSRSRENTYLYATPEVNFDRDEYAPRSQMREGLDHIAQAAERDGSQVSAHDAALRAELGQLSPADLARQVRELRAEAGAEHRNEGRHLRAEAEIERYAEHLESYRSASRSVHPSNEEHALERIAAERAERDQLPEIGHEARARASVAEDLLAERERAAATAARLSPPDYITDELGKRPSDPAKAREWDKAVHGIESYRLQNNVVDRDSALGARPKEHSRAHEHDQTQRQIEQSQRQLQLQVQRQRVHEHVLELGIGR
jgi:conjugative relaxase-like TrwC/TraI family protein